MEEPKELESVLKTEGLYTPSEEVVSKFYIKDRKELDEKAKDLESFWSNIAGELEWFKPWDKVLDWNPPFARWFEGGKCNIVTNALDRHVKTWRRNKAAIIWEGEEGRQRSMTYLQLQNEVDKFAAALLALGVKKGEHVTIYLPRIPEQVVAMLACAKLGAVHSIVYGGFSIDALRDRIVDAGARVLITADGGLRNGKLVEFKKIADEALKSCPSVDAVVVVRNLDIDVHMVNDRDIYYDVLMKLPLRVFPETRVMDASDPLFILYTSGTTGKPKGVVHAHGGYMVGTYITTKWVFDMRDDDIYWCTADPGWITGHSYIVYGPLLNGSTIFIYEGAPAYPDPGRWWSLIEKHRVSIFYTAPTAIRGLMRQGDEWPLRYNLSSLRILGSVGEPINPRAWDWYYSIIGKDKLPIIDTWWQTETGMFIITPFPSTPLKPGSATKPFPGIDVDIFDDDGNHVPANRGGNLVIKTPWPAMLQTIYKDPERYKKSYWGRFPGVYATGDSARRDEEGYIWIMGRTDDVIKVAGYRFGTAEIESALVSHPCVSEAAVIGKPHDLKGHVIKAFVVLKEGCQPHEPKECEALRREIINHVGKHMGPIARPEEIELTDSLPKTRSGKIMRRVLKAQELGLPVGDLSTMED
jgi:acetyl-CoA synthetase